MSSSRRRRVTAIVIAVLGVAALVVAGVVLVRGWAPNERTATPSAAVETALVLDRADPATGADDAIVRVDLAAAEGNEESVYAAPHIIDFVRAGDHLAVVSGVPDSAGVVSEHSLDLVSSDGGVARSVELPGAGTIDQLRASDGGLVGFTFTSAGDPLDREFANTLVWLDPGSDDPPEVVNGQDGRPIETTSWLWSGAATILAIGSDEQLILVDPVDNTVLDAFGEWESLEAVSDDELTAIVRDHDDTVLLGLSADSAESEDGTPFGPTPIDDRDLFGGSVVFVGDGPERVQKIGVVDAATARVDSMIVLDDGTTSRILYAAAQGEGIDGFSVSPDHRLVAVEVIPDVATMVSDAYYPFARATSIVTKFIDIESGDVVFETPGFGVEWAR